MRLNRRSKKTNRQTITASILGIAMLLWACGWAQVMAPIAYANSITVNSLLDPSDPGKCTLHDAILAANTNLAVEGCAAGAAYPAVDTITISFNAFTCLPCDIVLTGPLPTVTEDVIIRGPTSKFIRTPYIFGASGIRIFDLAGVTVQIINLNLMNGDATGLSSAGYGGAIRMSDNDTTLTVSNVYFYGNHANIRGGAIYQPRGTLVISNTSFYSNTSASYGGAIDQLGGVLIMENTTLANNSASDGGGLEIQSASDTRLKNVTFSGNRAANNGGGISRIGSNYLLTLNNVTLSNNMADSDHNGSGDGGGIYRAGGGVTFANSIIAGNFDTPNNAGPGTVYPDCRWAVSGGLTTYGYNLIGRGDGCTDFVNGVNGDKVGSNASPLNAMLAPLASNGGSTQTHALLPGSPAYEAGSPAIPGSLTLGACASTDQRGLARPIGGQCDSGAFESPVFLQLFLPLIRR